MKPMQDVILQTSDEKSINYKWETNVNQLSSLLVVSRDNPPETLDAISLIGGITGKDNVYVKNPTNPSEYIEITEAEADIFQCKIAAYSEILCALGAKTFTVDAELIEEMELDETIDGKISYKAVDIDIARKIKEAQAFKSKFHLGEEFYNLESYNLVDAYEKAVYLFKKYDLTKERQLKSLIDKRHPNNNTLQGKQTVKVNVAQEFNRMVEFAANAKAMGSVFTFSAGYHKSVKNIKTIMLTYSIEF